MLERTCGSFECRAGWPSPYSTAMEDWQRLDMDRIELEHQLVLAEQELAQVRLGAQPDQNRLSCLVQWIESCLDRLGPVNDRLARMRGPAAS